MISEFEPPQRTTKKADQASVRAFGSAWNAKFSAVPATLPSGSVITERPFAQSRQRSAGDNRACTGRCDPPERHACHAWLNCEAMNCAGGNSVVSSSDLRVEADAGMSMKNALDAVRPGIGSVAFLGSSAKRQARLEKAAGLLIRQRLMSSPGLA